MKASKPVRSNLNIGTIPSARVPSALKRLCQALHFHAPDTPLYCNWNHPYLFCGSCVIPAAYQDHHSGKPVLKRNKHRVRELSLSGGIIEIPAENLKVEVCKQGLRYMLARFAESLQKGKKGARWLIRSILSPVQKQVWSSSACM